MTWGMIGSDCQIGGEIGGYSKKIVTQVCWFEV
jgi:hypothetical protein